MKSRYLDVMERALDAYSTDQIDEYYKDVKETGLSEHGFARLVSNIGTMLAHGRKTELYDRFISMMTFCCQHVSRDRAANDFSVQEMLTCIDLVEERGAVDQQVIDSWHEELRKPMIYNEVAKSADQLAYNWVLFSATSEFLRMKKGLCPINMDFIDMQLATQIVHLDENCMYRDAAQHPPIVYDNVPRSLFSILMYYGYNGKYRDRIDTCLRRAGLLTLRMQSSTGESPYGGRSNQFYHNEAHLAIICEYEAARYNKEGNTQLAQAFKRAASDALASIEEGLKNTPIHHVKNRFPLETKYGCEEYAYFNKYMITVASFLNWARIFCDESILPADNPKTSPDAFSLSEDFHKVFLRAGDYFAQLDTDADPHYDASGLGRIHKRGAPGTVCLSCPGSASPSFTVDQDCSASFAIAPGIKKEGGYTFKTNGKYKIVSLSSDEEKATATLECELEDKTLSFSVTLTKSGVAVDARGEGEIAIMLPAFDFDGETHTRISKIENVLEISYLDSACVYTSNGEITDLKKTGCNRNGHYKLFCAHAQNRVTVRVSI